METDKIRYVRISKKNPILHLILNFTRLIMGKLPICPETNIFACKECSLKKTCPYYFRMYKKIDNHNIEDMFKKYLKK